MRKNIRNSPRTITRFLFESQQKDPVLSSFQNGLSINGLYMSLLYRTPFILLKVSKRYLVFVKLKDIFAGKKYSYFIPNSLVSFFFLQNIELRKKAQNNICVFIPVHGAFGCFGHLCQWLPLRSVQTNKVIFFSDIILQCGVPENFCRQHLPCWESTSESPHHSYESSCLVLHHLSPRHVSCLTFQ